MRAKPGAQTGVISSQSHCTHWPPQPPSHLVAAAWPPSQLPMHASGRAHATAAWPTHHPLPLHDPCMQGFVHTREAMHHITHPSLLRHPHRPSPCTGSAPTCPSASPGGPPIMHACRLIASASPLSTPFIQRLSSLLSRQVGRPPLPGGHPYNAAGMPPRSPSTIHPTYNTMAVFPP